MKLTLFLSVVTIFHLFATETYSQLTKLTLKLEDVKISDALNEIENQSEFFFLYSPKLVDVERKVNIDAENETINDILTNLFKDKVNFNVFDRQIILAPAGMSGVLGVLPEFQQQNRITGTVTDKNGAPLPGVNVVVTGTTMGTLTDVAGNYSIEVLPGSKSLTFSFIGMLPQEIQVGDQTKINITMADNIFGLEDVIVVGYGTQRKVNLTGAVSAVQVDAKISSRAVTNTSSYLTGLAPGLSVNQNSGMAGNDNSTILIRGLGTVNNASPLIVVDGMPDVDINRININDIESVSILKDASSSSVYGSRAANGVILVTTKSGKGMNKTNITISSSYAIEHPTNAYDFMADYPRALTLEQRLVAVNTLPENYLFKNGTIDQWMALGKINPLQYPNTDWWSIIIRDGVVQKNNVSISGGNEKSNFYVSGGTMNQKGLLINNDYSLYNARFSYDYKVTQKMNIGTRFSGNWSNYQHSNSEFQSVVTFNQFAGDMRFAPAGITPYDPVTGYYGGAMAYNEDPTAFNLLAANTLLLTHQNRQEVNTSLTWDWTPIKGLTARVDYGINYYNQFAWYAPTPARAYNFQTQSFGSRVYVGENAGVSNNTFTGYKTQLNGRLNYKIKIAEQHNAEAMIAFSEEYWYDRSQSASRNDRLYPTLHEIDAALTDIQSTGGRSDAEGLRSYIGRFNYNAYDKYLFEFGFRYDGSSRFLPGHQFGFFPSASLGWRFSEEDFLKSFTGNWLHHGKLRMSYGGLGNNSGVGRYEQKETLGTSNYILAGATTKGFVNSKMVNQYLSWERTNVMNIGMELGFLNNRLVTEIDYYNRLTTGMNRPSDISLLLAGAYTAPRTNIGTLRNRGIEGSFKWMEAKRNFNYSLTLIASYNRSLLEKWNEYLSRGSVFLNMPYNFLYIYQDIGIAQTWQDIYNSTPQGAAPGDILRVDLNGDGRIDDNDLKAYPKFQTDMPTVNFSLAGNIAWKGIDCSVLFQGSAGRKDIWLTDFNNSNFVSQRYATNWGTWNNPWSVENRDGSWPRLGGNSISTNAAYPTNNRTNQTFWLDDLSYLRLKNVQLGYTLPVVWTQKIGISNLRINGSAENLLTLTKYRGLDPEIQGPISSNAYPLSKSYSIGITMSF